MDPLVGYSFHDRVGNLIKIGDKVGFLNKDYTCHYGTISFIDSARNRAVVELLKGEEFLECGFKQTVHDVSFQNIISYEALEKEMLLDVIAGKKSILRFRYFRRAGLGSWK